jgi:hypothetical protein
VDSDLAYVVPQLALALPTLATLIAGLVLLNARRGRLSPRSRTLGVAGCLVLLLAGLVNAGYAIALPTLVREAGPEGIGLMAIAAGIVLVLLDSVGLGLLIAAVLAGSRSAVPPQQSWPPPQQAWPQSATGGGLLPPLEG